MSKRIIKKITIYLLISFFIYIVGFFVWKRQFRMDEMEKLVISNLWERENGSGVGPRSIITHQDYTMENLHITFYTGETCIVIWAYKNTMIIRSSKNEYYVYDRLRGSDRWHDWW